MFDLAPDCTRIRLHALDRFHFVLPRSLDGPVEGDPSSAEEHEVSKPTCTNSDGLKYSVGLIEQCISHCSQYLTYSQFIGDGRGVTIDTLTPPTGTSFVSRRVILLSSEPSVSSNILDFQCFFHCSSAVSTLTHLEFGIRTTYICDEPHPYTKLWFFLEWRCGIHRDKV